MSTLDITHSPYYDDFDPAKKYTQILALPGRSEQAREFTQLQTNILDMIKKLSAALFKEGSVIEGCSFWFVDNTLNISPGKVYLDGIIHQFDGGAIDLTMIGTELIGIKLEQTIITELEDPTLREPALGFETYGQPGSHRIKSDTALTLNDPTSPVIYKFIDGLLFSVEEKPQLEMINSVLARRTFDEAGNYRVHGLSMWAKDNDEDSIMLTVEAGKSYIQGFEVNKPSPTRLVIPKSKVARAVTGEPHVYQEGVDTYKLNNKNVSGVTRITATVQVTDTITRGSSSNGSDTLPHTPVVSIISSNQGATIYSSETDYQQTGNNIDWSLGGIEPSIGSSYTVVYQYNKIMILDVDFLLTSSGSDSYIDFSPLGDTPVVGTSFITDYTFYLGRGDRIYLDSEGFIDVLTGQSDLPDFVTPPLDSDPIRLSLGTVTLSPNSAEVTVNSSAITRTSMGDLHNIMLRLDNLEYNQAIADLDTEAMSGQAVTSLKGIFTDGFLGFSKCDLNHPLFSAAIDISQFTLTLGALQTAFVPTSDAPNTTAHNFLSGKFFTLPYAEEPVTSQTQATTFINVNPYQVFTGRPNINISPELDNWIDNENISLNNQTTTIQDVWGWWGTSSTIQYIGTTKQVQESIIPYARPAEIVVSGSDFPSLSDLITGYMDGVKVNLSPLSTTSAGTEAGTVKSDVNGRVNCHFTIPTGVRTGAREITLSNPVTSASTVFTSNGMKVTTTETVLTNKVIYRVRYPVDPIAQSFQLITDRFITSMQLFFSSKDPSIGVTVQIRGMNNGYPSIDVLGEVTLSSDQVSVSTDASIPTNIVFPQPTFCAKDTQYCMTVMTSSSLYNVHIAKLGQKVYNSSNFITGQPYNAGVLFTSSNALTWSAVQDSDLKFVLNGAIFEPNAVVQFNSIADLGADNLLVLADFDTPKGTSCVWEYKQNDSISWLPLDIRSARALNEVANSITLRATLDTVNSNVSPVISGQSLVLVSVQTLTGGSYISKLVDLSQPYTIVNQILEAYVPSGTTVTPQLSYDNGVSWVTPAISLTETVDGVYARYSYEYTLPGGVVTSQFRVRVDLTTSNPLYRPLVRKLLNILK